MSFIFKSQNYYICKFSLHPCFVLGTGFHDLALTGLELIMSNKVDWNSQRLSGLCLLSVGIKGCGDHSLHHENFYMSSKVFQRNHFNSDVTEEAIKLQKVLPMCVLNIPIYTVSMGRAAP